MTKLEYAIALFAILFGFSVYPVSDALKQREITKRQVSADSVEFLRLSIRSDSIKVVLAKLPPKVKYKFHPDTK